MQLFIYFIAVSFFNACQVFSSDLQSVYVFCEFVHRFVDFCYIKVVFHVLCVFSVFLYASSCYDVLF
jgi:hypothetical protein